MQTQPSIHLEFCAGAEPDPRRLPQHQPTNSHTKSFGNPRLPDRHTYQLSHFTQRRHSVTLTPPHRRADTREHVAGTLTGGQHQLAFPIEPIHCFHHRILLNFWKSRRNASDPRIKNFASILLG